MHSYEVKFVKDDVDFNGDNAYSFTVKLGYEKDATPYQVEEWLTNLLEGKL